MNIETLKENYPKLFSRLSDDITELRYILVIDENYNDVDSDEFDAIDPEDYNFLVYLTDQLQDAMGEKVFASLPDKFSKLKAFDDFYASQEDLYGVMTALNEEGIAKAILGEIEKEL
ncbi:MAG: hypothetical protein U9Q90_11195 [Campylobacterota bacterium]|nr:hypothetical protein [Campylobacterota bacterium]